MSSDLNHGFLVTIICESVLQDRLVNLFKTIGASGYTITQARGAGSHGRRMGDIAGYNTNIEVKSILTLETSDQLFAELKHVKENHALIVFRQKVEGLFN